MQLTIFERMALLQIVPKQADFRTLRIMADLQRDLAPTEEEIQKVTFRQEGDEYKWDDLTYKAEIPIGPVAADVIKQRLLQMDKGGVLEMQHVWIYERFVEPKQITKDSE